MLQNENQWTSRCFYLVRKTSCKPYYYISLIYLVFVRKPFVFMKEMRCLTNYYHTIASPLITLFVKQNINLY